MCFVSPLGWRGMTFGRDLFFSPNLKTETDPGICILANRKKKIKTLAKNTQMCRGDGGGFDLRGLEWVAWHERWNFSTRACWVSSNFPVMLHATSNRH